MNLEKNQLYDVSSTQRKFTATLAEKTHGLQGERYEHLPQLLVIITISKVVLNVQELHILLLFVQF